MGGAKKIFKKVFSAFGGRPKQPALPPPKPTVVTASAQSPAEASQQAIASQAAPQAAMAPIAAPMATYSSPMEMRMAGSNPYAQTNAAAMTANAGGSSPGTAAALQAQNQNISNTANQFLAPSLNGIRLGGS